MAAEPEHEVDVPQKTRNFSTRKKGLIDETVQRTREKFNTSPPERLQSRPDQRSLTGTAKKRPNRPVIFPSNEPALEFTRSWFSRSVSNL